MGIAAHKESPLSLLVQLIQRKGMLLFIHISMLGVTLSCRQLSTAEPEPASSPLPLLNYSDWIVDKPLLEAGPAGTFDEIAVKDPSIVHDGKRYHLFYTSKSSYETRDSLGHLSKNGSGLGYLTAPTLEQMKDAVRYDLGRIIGAVIVAPQVFYFEPQQCWYMIAQTTVEGKPDLMPVYLTNPRIEDVYGWSGPHLLQTGKSHNGFWIDFWVICDNEKAHLFYTDHEGSLFRFESPLEEFPDGFRKQKQETVLTARGETDLGRWRLHEASHIYFMKKYNCYFNIMEAVYPHPTRKNYWDSRNRFLFAMVADKLEGPWTRLESCENEFFGDPSNLFQKDGVPSVYDQVSHPELIRSGYDQRMEIEDEHLSLIFQAFDADSTGTDYDYNLLPWTLLLMKNEDLQNH